MRSKPSTYCVVFLFAGFLTVSGCSSSSNPAGPSDTNPNNSNNTPPPNNTPAPPPAPVDPTIGKTGSITITVTPNPVPFDGRRITDVASCAQRNNTWFYELTLKETGGAPVTLSTRIDAFDGFVVSNNTNANITVPANGETNLNPRWCSATSSRHTSQHTFSGRDSNGNSVNVQTPVITLQAR